MPAALSTYLSHADPAVIKDLLQRGICIPLFFDGDCALDNHTLIVLGDLTQEEAENWIGKITWKLNIPCGKFILLCGGGDADELMDAISGDPPNPNYHIFQTIKVPSGEYLVNIYAYLNSLTVQISFDEYDENCNLIENKELEAWYQANRAGCPDLGYIIQLLPLDTEPPFPQLIPEIDWCGEFEFRR